MDTKVRKEDLAHSRLLIQEFLGKTVEVMGNVSTPKCHYLIDNPKLTLLCGPLNPLCCIRYES